MFRWCFAVRAADRIAKIMNKIVVYLLIFWSMQITANIFFKWGSLSDSRWLWGFFGGNIFGFSSIWLVMLLHKIVNPNIVLGLASGGAFLLCQTMLAFVFNSKLAPTQWIGVMVIVTGIIMLAMGGDLKTVKDEHHTKVPSCFGSEIRE